MHDPPHVTVTHHEYHADHALKKKTASELKIIHASVTQQ